jgi:hypothetical protein
VQSQASTRATSRRGEWSRGTPPKPELTRKLGKNA